MPCHREDPMNFYRVNQHLPLGAAVAQWSRSSVAVAVQHSLSTVPPDSNPWCCRQMCDSSVKTTSFHSATHILLSSHHWRRRRLWFCVKGRPRNGRLADHSAVNGVECGVEVCRMGRGASSGVVSSSVPLVLNEMLINSPLHFIPRKDRNKFLRNKQLPSTFALVKKNNVEASSCNLFNHRRDNYAINLEIMRYSGLSVKDA
ncbi:hypothetical protein TNCV_2785231 [Trichonephila clavipes]|nr:hypothetical protein TNCV_2785231 [Trichonephila clavipes]